METGLCAYKYHVIKWNSQTLISIIKHQYSKRSKSMIVKRIRSVPGNNVLPVSSSAIIHPTDQISTKKHKNYTVMYFKQITRYLSGKKVITTCLIVMHPIKHNFWSSIPSCSNIASHFVFCRSGQPKI